MMLKTYFRKMRMMTSGGPFLIEVTGLVRVSLRFAAIADESSL